MSMLVKPLTWILGVVLTLVGVAGFFTDGMLLMFEVSALHNAIHILSGLVALWAAGTSHDYARSYLMIFGIVYGLVAVIGFTMGGSVLGLFMVNAADNYLHTVIAAACLIVGFGGKNS